MQNGIRHARGLLGEMPMKDEGKGAKEGRREPSQCDAGLVSAKETQ